VADDQSGGVPTLGAHRVENLAADPTAEQEEEDAEGQANDEQGPGQRGFKEVGDDGDGAEETERADHDAAVLLEADTDRLLVVAVGQVEDEEPQGYEDDDEGCVGQLFEQRHGGLEYSTAEDADSEGDGGENDIEEDQACAVGCHPTVAAYWGTRQSLLYGTHPLDFPVVELCVLIWMVQRPLVNRPVDSNTLVVELTIRWAGGGDLYMHIVLE